MARSRESIIEAIQRQVPQLRPLRPQGFCSQVLHRELSLPQLHILMALQDEGSMTVSELARVFDVSMPSASSIVDRMEERGLVVRSRHAEDRRVVTVENSDRGREVTEEFMGLKRDQLQQTLNVMTTSELGDVHTGLEALIRAISRLNGSAQEPAQAAS